MDFRTLTTSLQVRLATNERGAAMVEYGLLLALIFLVAIVAVQSFGGGVSSQFSSVDSHVVSAG